MTADEEEEVQSGQQQLAIRPADMSFEQAMRHYLDEIARTSKDTNSQLQTLDNRQAHVPTSYMPASLLAILQDCAVVDLLAL